jgi:hypothetical protein
MLCYCSTSIDIRARCLPERNRKMWNKCRSKIDTTYWFRMNDYDIYKIIDEYCFEDDGLIDAVQAKYFITYKDGEGILELYANDSDTG